VASSTDIWSILIIITLAQGAFVITAMIAKRLYRKTAGKWMLALLIGLFWLQLEFLFIRWPYNMGLSLFYGTRHGSWLAIGPIFYFYVRSLLGKSIRKTDYLLLTPFVVFTLLLPLLLEDFLSFRQMHYGMLTPFDNWPDQISAMQYVYSFVFIAQFFYLLYFLLKTSVFMRGYQLDLQKTSSSLPDQELRWLNILWVGLLAILALGSLLIVLLFFTEVYRRHMDYLYVIPSSFLFYAVSYRLMGVSFEKTSEVFKYEKSGLKQNEMETYAERVKKVIEQEKLYLQQGLKLKDLSEKIEIPSHQLSEVLNQSMQTTFFDLVNRYRVEEAKERIKAFPDYTLLQIAYDSGFNNKTSFVNAFRRFEGTTPSRFMKKSA